MARFFWESNINPFTITAYSTHFSFKKVSMFLLESLLVLTVVFWISAGIAECVMTTKAELSLGPAVRVGFGFFISLVYFAAACLFLSIQQAWFFGLILLMLYAYGNRYAFLKGDKRFFQHFIGTYIYTFLIFLLGSLIFFLPLIIANNYGPFTEGGGDISIYADSAKYLQSHHLTVLGMKSNYLSQLFNNIKEVISPKSFAERWPLFDSQLVNPPAAEYANYRVIMHRVMNYFDDTPYQIYSFLTGTTNYPVYFGIQSFIYVSILAGIWYFFRIFNKKTAILAVLVMGNSYGILSVFYNMYSMQAICLAISALFLSALPRIRITSWAGFRVFGCSIIYTWLSYPHFLSVILPLLMASFFLHQKDFETQVIQKKYSLFMQISTVFFLALCIFVVIFGSEFSIRFIKLLISGIFDQHAHLYLNDSVPIKSFQWFSFIFGLLSQQHFEPFVKVSPSVIHIIHWGVLTGMVCFLLGFLIMMKVFLNKGLSFQYKNFYFFIYLSVVFVVLIQLYVGRSSLYFQAKSAQNVLICFYTALLLPMGVGVLTLKDSLQIRYLLNLFFIVLTLFIASLGSARFIYIYKLALGYDRGSILESSYFFEAKKVKQNDPQALVLFEPRKSADLYISIQPFFGMKMLQTRSLSLQYESFDKDKYVDHPVFPSDFIAFHDIAHIWTLSTECQGEVSLFHGPGCTWKAEKLFLQQKPKLLLFADDYERHFGQKQLLLPNNKKSMTVSYLRNGSAMVFVPPNILSKIEVVMQPIDKDSYSQMVREITERIKKNEFGKNIKMVRSESSLILTYQLPKDTNPTLKMIARYSGEYWLSVKMNNSELS